MIDMKGKLVKLRALELDDALLIYQWENQPEVWRTSHMPGPYSMESIRQYVQNALVYNVLAMQQVRFMIETLKDKTPIGMVDLFDLDMLNGRAGIGIMIDGNYRARGFAGDALRLIIAYGFQHLHLHQLYVDVVVSNAASMRLFQKAGFVITGHRRDWVRNGPDYEDVIFMQLFHSSFKE